VDDGSHDATRDIAQSKGVRVLTQANRGAAAARNLGAEKARGDIVLFIDGDCEPESNWIQAMVAPLRDSEIVGACGMKRTHQRGLIPRFIQLEFDYRYDRERELSHIDFIDSGTAAYRREIFLKCGGFDTTLSDAEDTDLSYRLSEQGYRMAFADGAIVYHAHPESPIEYFRRKFVYGYWRSQVYARHPRKIASDSRTPQTQKIQGVLALLFPVALVGTIVWRESAWIALAIAVLIGLTTLPFMFRYLRRDWQAALLTPLLIGLASFTGGAGIALGLVRRWLK
jgi:GT2 family glycosyltransferase